MKTHRHVPGAELAVGERCYIDPSCVFHLTTGITIGDDVLMSRDCLLSDTHMHSLKWEERAEDLTRMLANEPKDWGPVKCAPIVIEDKAWIGTRCIILAGSHIGEGAVVGAGSVVTGAKIPPYTLWAGNPARQIKADLR